MKASLPTVLFFISSISYLNAQLNPDWVEMTVPAKAPTSISMHCGKPTLLLDGQVWQSPDLGLTWQVANDLTPWYYSESYTTSSEVIYSNVTPTCSSSQTLVKFFDCQSPNTPYFQYTASGEDCWHSGGSSYGMTILYDSVWVLGTGTWQYMGPGSYCAHSASLDLGHSWFNVPCDFRDKYYPDTTLSITNNQLMLHMPGYNQPIITLGANPDSIGYVLKTIYRNGKIFLLKGNPNYDNLRLFTSSDLGQQWELDSLQSLGYLGSLYFSGDILFLTTSTGIYFKSAPYQSPFQAVYEFGTYQPVIFANSSVVIVPTQEGQLMVTHDLGQSWQFADIPVFSVGVNSLYHNGEALLTFTDEYYPMNMVVMDSDTSFHRDPSAKETLDYPKAAFELQGLPYKVTVNGNVYKTLNQGQTWEYVSSPHGCCANIVELDGDTLFISSGNDTIKYSIDGAQTWMKVILPSPSINIKTLAVNGQDWLAMKYSDNGLLHYSSSTGLWEDVTPSNFEPKQLNKTGSSIYVLGVNNQQEWTVRKWDSIGQQWQIVGDVLTAAATKDDAGDDFFLVQTTDSVFVRQANGLWKTLETPFAPVGHINDWLMFDTTLYAATSMEGLWRASLKAFNCNPITTLNSHLCQGDSIWFNGDYLFNTGSYTAYFPSQNGSDFCDSIAVLNLEITDSLYVLNRSICQGDSMLFGGNWLKATGTYTEYFTGQLGCDSISMLNLTVFTKSPDFYENVKTCGSPYYLTPFGFLVMNVGHFEFQVSDINGCPFIYELDLDYVPQEEYYPQIDTFVVFPFTLFDSTYYVPGDFYQSFVDSNGCEGVIAYHIFESISATNGHLNKMNEYALFPNPASSSVTLQFDTPPDGDCTVHFINQLGQKLLAKQLECNSKTHTIDIGELSSGLYFVEISGPNQPMFTTKLHIVR